MSDVASALYGGAPDPADAGPTPVIRAVDLAKRYKLGKENFVDALRCAAFEVAEGEMVAIVGPSGSGKSTAMHLVGCLDSPDSGEVWLNGRATCRRVGRSALPAPRPGRRGSPRA